MIWFVPRRIWVGEFWGLSRYKLSYDKLCGATASTRRVLTQASRVGHRSSGRKEGWRKKAKNVGPAARRSGANGQDQCHLVCAAGTGKRSNALRRGAWPYSRRTAVGTGRAVLSFRVRRVDPNGATNGPGKLASEAIESCVQCISYPACVLDKYWTPLFWNAKLEGLFPQWLKGPERNVLRFMFLDLSVRTLVGDWEPRARRLLAHFRLDFGRHIDDPKMLELVEGLSEESDLFRQCWKEQQVLWWDGNEKSFNHPQWGLLTFFQTTFLAASDPTLKLVILRPYS